MFFAEPQNLYWLLVLVPMVAAAIWYGRWQRGVSEEIGDPELVAEMSETRSGALRRWRIGLVLAGLALLCLAAAQPKWGRIQQKVEQEGIDIVFALDLSKSMLAEDAPPTRLQAATGEIEQTLDGLDGDRAGMVVFTTVSFVQSPLTTDYGAIRFYLDKLDPSQMSVGGTAVGRALRDSVELLTGESLGDSDGGDEKAAPDPASTIDRAENQLVVLFTDGEDHATDPIADAETARNKGIHVVTVGVGRKEGAKIPVHDRNGNVRGYKRDPQGNIVRTKLEEKQLRDIAEKGGGIYVRYSGDGSVSERLGEFVGQLEKSKLEAKLAERFRDRYMWFLVPGFLLLLVSFLLGERRRGRFGWSEASSATLVGVVVLLGGLSAGCDSLLRSPHEEVERGNTALEQGNYQKAKTAYESAEKSLGSDEPALYYDRGLAHLGAAESEKARQAFARALESPDPSLRFDAHYNVGLSFLRKEKWKPALEELKHAFRIYQEHPSAIDESALSALRINTELAYRKLYPPCSSQEDDLEENDVPKKASRLKKKKQKKDLTLCGLDDDWFAIRAGPGATITVETTFRKLGKHRDPEHTFLPSPEDLKLELKDASGGETLASDSGDADRNGPIEKGPVHRSIDEFVVGEDVALGGKGRLLVRLSAADQLEYSYEIDIQVEPPCRALEEDAEENDSRERATRIKKGNHQMQLCPGDPDWFEVDAKMGDSLFVDVRPMKRKKGPSMSPEDVQLALLDARTGEPVGDPHREGPFSTAGVHQVRNDRSFHIGVTGTEEDAEGAYRLDVYRYAPCIVGDDRHEENDSLSELAKLKGKSKFHRYLRLCPKDPDFFAVKPKAADSGAKRPSGPPGSGGSKKAKEKSVRLGLRLVEGGAGGSGGERDETEVSLEALDERTGGVVESARKPKRPTTSKESKAPFDRVLSMKDVDDKKVPVRVSGDPTFYHLSDLTGRNNQSKNKRNKDNKKKDKKNKNDKRNKDSQKNKRDNQAKNNQKKKKKKENQQQKDSPKPSDSDKKKQARKKKKSLDEKRMRDILKALEDSDKNFQMRKALEDSEHSNDGVSKDW